MVAWEDYEIRNHRKGFISEATTNMMIEPELTIKILVDAMEYYRKAGKGDADSVRQDMMDYVDLDIMEKHLTTMKDKGIKQKGKALLHCLRNTAEAKRIVTDYKAGQRSRM